MSTYSETMSKLIETICHECAGSGEVDDATIGDIFYNTFTCPKCKGTGFNPNNSKQTNSQTGETK